MIITYYQIFGACVGGRIIENMGPLRTDSEEVLIRGPGSKSLCDYKANVVFMEREDSLCFLEELILVSDSRTRE